MRNIVSRNTLLAAAALGVLGVTGCQSHYNEPRDWRTSPLDANPATLELNTDVLEILLPEARTSLLVSEKGNIESFVARYADVGRGELLVSTPVGAANGQLALQSVADVREIANARGVDYNSIRVRTYDATGSGNAPLVLAYDYYEAKAPDCPLLSRVDMSDVSNNSELPTIGCAVNANLAAMIADPADLVGARPIDDVGPARADRNFDAYEAGEDTASQGDVDTSLAN